MSVKLHKASDTELQVNAVIGDAYWRVATMLWIRRKFPDWSIIFTQVLFQALTCADSQVWIARKNAMALAGESAHAKSQVFEAELAKMCLEDYAQGMEYIEAMLETALEKMCATLPPHASGNVDCDDELPLLTNADDDESDSELGEDDGDDTLPTCKLEAMVWEIDAMEDVDGWVFTEHPDASDEARRWEAKRIPWHGYGKSKGSAQFKAILHGYLE